MENQKQFIVKAKEMWSLMDHNKVELKPELNEISNPLLKALLPKKNITYWYKKIGNTLSFYIRESSDIYDWRQNFMAWTVKVPIGGYTEKFHVGFYLTAITVFNDMERLGLLDENTMVDGSYGFSHGAGANPTTCILIMDRSKATLVDTNVHSFEQPKFIKKPSKRIKDMCKNFTWYKQGNDFVTKVAPGMSHLGQEITSPSQGTAKFEPSGTLQKLAVKLSKVITGIQDLIDHDIYWTKEVEL